MEYSFLSQIMGSSITGTVLDVVTTTSTIDVANTIVCPVAFPAATSNLPIIAFLPGFNGTSVDYTTETRQTLASYGLFCIFVDMRGRGSSTGNKDVSARELHDIYDAINFAKTKYHNIVDDSQIWISGYSGGGGNVLGSLCKFPDFYNGAVDFFGVSDYGEDETYGMYQQLPAYQSLLSTQIGGTPTTAPNRYKSRNALTAIGNYTGGHLWIFHDTEDAILPVNHSTRLIDTLNAAEMTNYTASISTAEDSPRWYHDGTTFRQADPLFVPSITGRAYPAWTISASGIIKVIGYLKTKRFTVWTNANGTATLGLDATANIAYDTATDTYTVTPLTGAIDVVITQGAKSGSATNISTATEIVVT